MLMDIGIDKKNRKMVSDALTRVLADNVILSLKARNYHWNVTGPHFGPLHEFFQSLYESLETAADDIAERIRALGFKSPGSYVEFISISALKEEIEDPEYLDMIERLAHDVEHLARRSDEVKEVAMMIKDDATADLMIEHLRSLEKSAWMLRSYLD